MLCIMIGQNPIIVSLIISLCFPTDSLWAPIIIFFQKTMVTLPEILLKFFGIIRTAQ